MSTRNDVLIALKSVARVYADGAAVTALRDIQLTIRRGEFVALMGPSGCGKSTLLHVCGAMDRPTTGEIVFDGAPLHRFNDDELTRVRRERIGFVFQFFNLLPTLTVFENVVLPMLLAGRQRASARRLAEEALRDVVLLDRAEHYPQQLSGGEMQRCAIARAIAHEPDLIIADEPTGSLDSENGKRVLDLLRGLHRAKGVTILLATHAQEVASAADRIVWLRDGALVAQDTRG